MLRRLRWLSFQARSFSQISSFAWMRGESFLSVLSGESQRLVILAGPASFIQDSFKLSKPFSESLLQRGILVVPFVTDGSSPKFEFEETKEINTKRKRLWQLAPVYAADWSKWLDEQKKLAKVSPESPVDGRVRGSGIGYPPWNAYVVQLPPVKGIWTGGLLDGRDGRV